VPLLRMSRGMFQQSDIRLLFLPITPRSIQFAECCTSPFCACQHRVLYLGRADRGSSSFDSILSIQLGQAIASPEPTPQSVDPLVGRRNLFVLIVFKYLVSSSTTQHRARRVFALEDSKPDIPLPIAFRLHVHIISYLVDVYRGVAPRSARRFPFRSTSSISRSSLRPDRAVTGHLRAVDGANRDVRRFGPAWCVSRSDCRRSS